MLSRRGIDAPGIRNGAEIVIGALVRAGLHLWRRYADLLGVAALVSFLVAIAAMSWLRPVHNWDVIAYIGSALERGGLHGAVLHETVWSIVRASVPPEAFDLLAKGDAYRLRQFVDPAAFESQLGMYSVKWLYVTLLEIGGPRLGFLQTAMAINGAALLAIGATLTVWLGRLGRLYLLPLVVGFLMIAGFPAIAMAENPDLLAAAFVLVVAAALERRRIAIAGGAMVLAVLTRPDMIVLAGLLLPAAWYFREKHLMALSAVFLACFAAYSFSTHVGEHPGYWAHLWFSTYHMQDTMENFHPALSLKVYLVAFLWNLVRSAFEDTWLGLYMIALTGWIILASKGTAAASKPYFLIAALLGAIAAKFVLFPLHDTRTYFPMLLPAFLILGLASEHLWTWPAPRSAERA